MIESKSAPVQYGTTYKNIKRENTSLDSPKPLDISMGKIPIWPNARRANIIS